MRSSGLTVNGRLARPHVTCRLAIDYVVEQQSSHSAQSAGCRKNVIGSYAAIDMERTAAPCICHNPIMDEFALAPTPMVLKIVIVIVIVIVSSR
jgi:hypothetical protein